MHVHHIHINLPDIALLRTLGPSSPLLEEESSPDLFFSFDDDLCFFFDFFFVSLLLRFRWWRSSFFLLLLFDLLFLCLCFLDLLRSSYDELLLLLLLKLLLLDLPLLLLFSSLVECLWPSREEEDASPFSLVSAICKCSGPSNSKYNGGGLAVGLRQWWLYSLRKQHPAYQLLVGDPMSG